MMFIEIVIAIFVGISFGVFTGLTPGIHVNLISLIIVSLSPFLLNYIEPVTIAVFIIAMALTHTFADAVPGIYLGAPDSSQVLNVLPGHRMLLKGEGHNALKLTVIGSLLSLLLCLVLSPLFILLMFALDPLIKDYIGYLLIAIMAYMILKEKKPSKVINAFLMFTMSGTLGMIVLNTQTLKQPLFPLLSGLFGFSLLIISIMQKIVIPEQKTKKELVINKKTVAKAATSATWMGFAAGFLPGFGSSQAAIIAQQFVGNIGDKGFLVLVGGINTANMLVSIATLYSIEKARNGAIIAVSRIIQEININSLIIFLLTALIVAGIATAVSLKISKVFCKWIVKVNYTKTVMIILSFITILTFYFDGIIGILILLTSTAVGIVATELNVGKNHLMGCLLVPVICYFVM